MIWGNASWSYGPNHRQGFNVSCRETSTASPFIATSTDHLQSRPPQHGRRTALVCKETWLVAPSYSLPSPVARPDASIIAICLPMYQPEVMIAGVPRSNARPSCHTRKLTAMFILPSVSLMKGLVTKLSEPKSLPAVIHPPLRRTRFPADCTHDGLMVGLQN